MIEPTKLTIESPEVLDILKRYGSEARLVLPWAKDKVKPKERQQWMNLVAQHIYQWLVDVGYFKFVGIPPTGHGQTYFSKVQEVQDGAISIEQFDGWCKDNALALTVDLIELVHQKQFGLPEVGYVPSERLVKGREALTRYQEAQQSVDPFAHTSLFEKLKEEVVDAGFDELEQFLLLNEALP